MTKHRHRWQRLSDVALFCACGETKYVVAPVCTLLHYPTYYPWYPQPTYWPIWTSGGTISTGDVSIGSTVYGWPDDNATYTLTGGSA